MEKTILVIGGTGMLGQPVAHSLAEAGFRVRIMTRDHEKAQEMFDDSFEVFAADPMDSARLDEALDGCYGVHISLPTEVEQQVAESVARFAPRLGVERISYISGSTVAEETRWSPLVDRKFLAEQAIREAGLPYTIFCPAWFMETLPKFVVGGRASVLGKQPCPYHWVAAHDYARMVSMAYSLEAAANKRFIVLGPEAVTMHDALERYCALFHPEIKEVSTTPLWIVRLMAIFTRNRELKGAVDMMAYFDKVGEGSKPPVVDTLLGVPTTTLDTWLQERKEVGSAAPPARTSAMTAGV